MSDILRNFLGLLFLLGADIIVIGVFVALVIANYLACKSAFDYLGYDAMPLGREAFIGQIIGPFFPEATVSHFYAFVVAVVIAMGLYILCNRVFHIWELIMDRRGYLAKNDRESAQIVLYHIGDDICLIIAILPFLIPVVVWDFDLFKFRSVFGSLGIEDPAQAPLTVVNWDNQVKQNGHLFAWVLARVGAFGYIGVTGVASVSMDFCFRRTVERFMMLLHSLENVFLPVTQQEEPKTDGPEDSNGTAISSPVPQQHTTQQLSRQSSSAQGAVDTRNPAPDGAEMANEEAAKSVRTDDSQGSLFDDETFQNVGGGRNEDNGLKDVIGKTGERVSLTTAMADNDRYWVDPDSLEIWDRDYRRTLFPGA